MVEETARSISGTISKVIKEVN